MDRYDEQLDLRRRHPTGRFFMLCNEAQSVVAKWTLESSLDVSYGTTAKQKVDIFPAANPGAPVFFFIHGGYFRALDKRQYRYLARPLGELGYTTVLVNYDLAPTVRVAEIVEQNLRAFRWVHANVARWNGNPDHIVICGHSVGAFLVAKILEQPWDPKLGSAIHRAVMLSGIFDLNSMRESYLNQTLGLTQEDVETLSPMFGQTRNRPPTLIAVGGDESEEFIAQSERYSEKLEGDGHEHELKVLPGRNHYTVSRLLSTRNEFLTQSILGL